MLVAVGSACRPELWRLREKQAAKIIVYTAQTGAVWPTSLGVRDHGYFRMTNNTEENHTITIAALQGSLMAAQGEGPVPNRK